MQYLKIKQNWITENIIFLQYVVISSYSNNDRYSDNNFIFYKISRLRVK